METHNPYAIVPTWYVPRRYADQWYGLYGHPSRARPAQSERLHPTDFFDARTGAWARDGPQTVEDVITRGYLSVPYAVPETAAIDDKRTTAWLGLEDSIHQIRQRHGLYRHNCYDLELAKCAAANDLHAQVADQGQPANEHQRESLAKRLQECYGEQRAERITLWRDVSRLRTGIPESAQLYLSAHRKLSILGGDGA